MDQQRPIEEEKKEVQVERRVPQGREARNMDRFIRMNHGVGAVFESESERDSWSKKSVQASLEKQSDDQANLVEDYLRLKQEISG